MDRKVIAFVSILLILLSVGVYLFVKMNKPYNEIIDMNWSVKIPRPGKKIYSANSGVNFSGYIINYNIFEYKKEEDISLFLQWNDDKNKEIESAVEKVLDELGVDNENMPDFTQEYKYNSKTLEDSSKIYLIFFQDTKMLYVIEDFN